MTRKRHSTATPARPARVQEVYDGRQRLGLVRDYGDKAIAFLADGTRIGVFAKPALAVDAVLAAARGKATST